MPLALSRTARTLNTWTPNGQIAIVGLSGTFKKEKDLNPTVDLLPDPVYLPQKAPSKFNGSSAIFNGRGRRRHRRLNSAALQAIELNLAPYRNGVQNNGFAQEPKPKFQESPVSRPKPEPAQPPATINNDSPSLGVQSPSNQDVHFGVPGSGKHRRFSTVGVSTPVRSVCPDPGVQCASALFLTTGSPQSIGHLRKWNSQSNLSSDDLPGDSNLKLPELPALRRNASLPDLRLAEQLDATGLHRARPRCAPDLELQSPLMRSPSDTGRALCFWVEEEEGVRTFHDMPAQRRIKYEQKIALYRHQTGTSNSSLNIPSSKPSIVARPSSPSRFKPEIDILTLDSLSLAQELTQLSRELLLAVEPAELLTYVMKPRMAEVETCPNLHRLLQFYERLTALVSSEILRHPTTTKRAQILALFIETAEHCYALQNWQACCVLLTGIRSPPIVRLKDTWYQIRTHYSKHFGTFNRLVYEGNGPQNGSSDLENGGRPRPLAAVPYFGEIVARVRARPTVLLRPPRPLWKEPPSLAKWVDEQTSGATECDQCQSTLHKNRACCYLMVFVLGKNLFCPIRRMPPAEICTENTQETSVDSPNDSNVLQRLHLAQLFDDPDSLPFTSRLVQCCALQPGNITHVRQRVEIFLRTAQATARAYDLQNNPSARHYWLHQPYSNMKTCMKKSTVLEPLTESATKQRQIL